MPISSRKRGSGGGAEGNAPAAQGILGTLVSLLVAERTGFQVDEPREPVEPTEPVEEEPAGSE